MSLQRYHQKRDFRVTPEPRGRVASGRGKQLSFVVQKHAASHLHYDFRLELGGVLLSWAVPKGPSLDTADKRLAMHVEDHPLEYGGFEGSIPAHQYGGGTVMVWDRGTWIPHADPAQGYATGHLKFELDGEKLKGGWMLVRSHGGKYGGKYGGKRAGDVWFLIKERDEFARADDPIAESAPDSVLSGRSLEEIANDRDRVWQSDRSVKQNLRAGAVEPRRAARTSPVKSANTVKTAKVARTATRANAEPPAMPAGARRAKLPAQLSPMLATLVKETPAGEGWLHEIKYDGYRMLARIERGKVRIQSRNGKDWTSALPTIAKALSRVALASAWLDGELAVADARGHTSFQQLQNALSSSSSATLTYFVFDLPFANGYDLRGVALRERKAMLRALLDPPPAGIRYGVEIEAAGGEVFRQACTLGLEGIVSKRLDSTYAGVRSREWLKVKCGRRQEMVIGGFTDPAGARDHFGALLTGVYDDAGKLRYSGRVGTGFDDAALRKLHAQLVRLEIAAPPFANAPRGARARGVHWVKPVLVAEVAFTEWTDEGTLRHPAFLGLRVDKDATRVTREREQATPSTKPEKAAGDVLRQPAKAKTAAARVTKASTSAPGATKTAAAGSTKTKAAAGSTKTKAAAGSKKTKAAAGSTKTKAAAGSTKNNLSSPRADPDASVVAGVRLSNPDKLYFPEAKISKRDVARYYETVAPRLLPHLAGRPLSLVRCPDGWKGQCFYQKHAATALSAEVGRIQVRESKGLTDYAEVHSAAGLAGLVQWGVIEIHPWGSRTPKLDRPDRLIFDFDPDDAVAWDALVDGVQALRKLLTEMGLPAFLKTTGGKGLHVVVPMRPSVDWETAKGFTRAVAELMANTFPDRFVATVSKLRRKDRIYIDYLRNAQGATAVAPYGVRARADAPVATPIEWNELTSRADLRFAHFNLRNVPARIAAQRADPWRAFDAQAVSLTAAIRKRVGAG